MARGLNYVKIDLNILKISTYIENNNKRNGQKFLVSLLIIFLIAIFGLNIRFRQNYDLKCV